MRVETRRVIQFGMVGTKAKDRTVLYLNRAVS